tara:strand:+ start:3211 stop:3462 length:252 start_codon:yes stop_codon:yes gene_type:complete
MKCTFEMQVILDRIEMNNKRMLSDSNCAREMWQSMLCETKDGKQASRDDFVDKAMSNLGAFHNFNEFAGALFDAGFTAPKDNK